MEKRNIHTLVGGVSITLAMALSTPVLADLRIGVAGPHTGPNAAFGEQMWRGAQQAAEDINAKGGINGEKIVLVKGDDACEPKQAVAAANKLVDSDKVVGVIGHYCSSSSMPASEIYDEAGVLTITPASSSPKLTERGLATFFRMSGRDDQQGQVAADYIAHTLKATQVAVIHDKDTFGQGVADTTRLKLKEYGVDTVLYEGLTRGEKDFNALVTKLRSVSPQVVYFGGCHPEAGPLVRQMREQGMTAKFVSDDCVVTDQLVTTAGGAQFTDGVLMTFYADPRSLPGGQQVLVKLREKGFEPEGYTLFSYAALQAMAAAFNGVGTTQGLRAADWLKSHTVDTILGQKSWDKKGDLKESPYVMYQWDAQGRYHQL
ncbi:branched-chain amino acid ABC transporter substrate-binding protein [Pseudomonas gingeri NCPPB 3146 = LMG 5327]|uniref:Branched-chain amino acid ABC transporter substrate-binding protein n=2 Tax=Pseudomonas gingeri TaxID=117681 RepID=A0A7Y8CGC4_9PSED|nr:MULTISPECIES: branched-chain amino acid ABC transporter substrate-binding protein [Pseudomonas]NWC17758.1 branched-chain amino acid ABC transporter substrate-binding protein [Pseudomonas gingeri]NWE48337.1 branched-chain amino acid ABC transporter substrate-binding protein [Pseudomonas gingeri]NWE69092.1 branched-chain amino acid ABC transporter substrate-binding protein [Pseudomonas gingeri]PNQ92590.1 branched-chain amino acid ABC transporter substrate-binding protein [Pseudomonas gingeri N